VSKELELEAQIISLEAVAGTEGLFSAIDRLPKFVGLVRDQFIKFVGAESDEQLPVNYTKLARQIAVLRYSDLISTTVYVPPGLNVRYLDYIRSLETAEKDILGISGNVIGPFAVWIARLLSNPGELASQRDQLNVQGMVMPDLDAMRKCIMDGISGTDKTTERTYGKMVARNQDWGTIESRLDELNNHLIADERVKLIRQVNDLVDNIDLLVERVKGDAEEYQFSAPSLSLLADACYKVARVLELYAVYGYQLRLLTVAIHDTQKSLTRAISQGK
jgi:hypothetical protein